MTHFRQLTPADGDCWYEVLHAGYQSLAGLPISFDAINAPKEEALKWLKQNPTYGILEENRMVAVASLRMPWGPLPGPEKYPHYGFIAVHPDFQGQGYAKKLLAAIEEQVLIALLRTPAVTLGTAQEHPWLVSMYRSMGFVPLRTVQLEGKRHHTVFMKKDLSQGGDT